MENLSLFGTAERPLARRLKELAAEGVYFGTSSWKYEGWLGQIYTPERYYTRGRFSQKKFEAGCLAEYAETFPAVCGDFSFYQFPSDDYWQRLFASAPESLLFAFKVPEIITVRQWPTHARYGARGGQPNEMFLDAELLDRAFLRPLRAFPQRVAAFIFEFGSFPKSQYEGLEPFAADLERFLDALPLDFRYAVEIRNKEFLDPVYFEVLARRNVAHVFNSWTRMPELPTQIDIPEAFTADFTVARALLRAGRTYEQAVRKFQPYQSVQEPNPAAREGLRTLMDRALSHRQLALLFVNNRLEGNAPGTVEAVAGASEQN